MIVSSIVYLLYLFIFNIAFNIYRLFYFTFKDKFEPGWHSMLGLFFLIGMGSQTIIGVVAHLRFDLKRLAPPFFPDKLHWYLGRSMFFLGSLTVLLGLYYLPARHMANNSFYLWLVVVFFLILALEKYVGQSHETPTKGIVEDHDDAWDGDDDDVGYIPKKRSNLHVGRVEKQVSSSFLFKLLGPAGITVSLILF